MVNLKNIFKSEFSKNLFTLSSGTAVAQAIPMLATLILSRLYSPSEMGAWGLFASYTAVLSVIGCLRYDYAIVKPFRIIDSNNLSFISIAIAFIFVIVLYCILAVIEYFPQLRKLFPLSDMALGILPLYVLCLLLVQILTNLANKNKKYSYMAISSIGRSSIQATTRITLGSFSFTNIGLVLGALLGAFFYIIYLSAKLNVVTCYIRTFSFKRAYCLLREYKDFPKYDLLSATFNSVSSNMPVIILSYFFIDNVVGYFSMALTLLFIPMSIVGTSLGQLYYKNACELYSKQKSLNELTQNIFIPTYIGCGFFMLLLIWGGEVIFGFLLGNEWRSVGRYVTYLSLWLLLVTSVSPLSSIFYVKDKQRINLYFNIVGLLSRILVLLIGGYFFKSSDVTVLLFGVVSFLLFAAQGYVVKKMAEVIFSKEKVVYLSILTMLLLLSIIYKVYIWLI